MHHDIVNLHIQPDVPEGSIADFELFGRVLRPNHLAAPLQVCAGRLQVLCSRLQLRRKLSADGRYLNRMCVRRDSFRSLLGDKKQLMPIVGGCFRDVRCGWVTLGEKGGAKPDHCFALLGLENVPARWKLLREAKERVPIDVF